MHVLVLAAVYQMHQAAQLDLVWMSSPLSCLAPLHQPDIHNHLGVNDTLPLNISIFR